MKIKKNEEIHLEKLIELDGDCKPLICDHCIIIEDCQMKDTDLDTLHRALNHKKEVENDD